MSFNQAGIQLMDTALTFSGSDLPALLVQEPEQDLAGWSS